MHAKLPSVSYSVVKDRSRRMIAARRSKRRQDLWAGLQVQPRPSLVSGGDSGARTRNLRLAKPALSQLSYIPGTRDPGPGTPCWGWWAWVDSNHPPHAYQACALTN